MKKGEQQSTQKREEEKNKENREGTLRQTR
jgi:hypothetical protein